MKRLLDAGMHVFAERGYHAARVDDIVRAARTSHGTVSLYFANKEALCTAGSSARPSSSDDHGARASILPDRTAR